MQQSHIPATASYRQITLDTFTGPEDSDIPDSTVVSLPANFPADFPPESFWLSKDAEFDWFDRNAFLERKESTKRSSHSMNLNPNVNPSHSNSSSQRHSVNLKSKAAIIGLPKTQKTTYVDSKRRPANVRLFPKRSYSIGRAPVTEPSSPKVSCIGRVRSKRCRSRRKSTSQTTEPVKKSSSRRHKSGLMSRITSLFRSDNHGRKKTGKSSEKVREPVENSGSRRICVSVKPVSSEPGTPSGPPVLGGMIRFASGRRSESWYGGDDDDVAGRHSLDFGRRGVEVVR